MKKVILLVIMVIFMTSLIYGVGPLPVDLGTAENFVILASTGVSTNGATSIVGNIGVSPVAASYITGFGLIMDASGTFSTSSLVTGSIYAASYTTPTPTILTTAVGAMGTAYTDAAGRLNPNFTELYAGNLTGRTLIPGLYKWGTSVLINAAGMTISGGPDDVWIFQISQNLIVANGAIITLSGGARPQNIYWQIAGQANLGTTVQFKGIVLSQTLISLNTGATLNGRLLAQTAVTLEANSIIAPAGSTGNDNIPAALSGTTLGSSYPNPFHNKTTIHFNIERGKNATLTIYNVKGQIVSQGEFASGVTSFEWNTEGLPTGVYMYRLQTDTQDISKKMSLVK